MVVMMVMMVMVMVMRMYQKLLELERAGGRTEKLWLVQHVLLVMGALADATFSRVDLGRYRVD